MRFLNYSPKKFTTLRDAKNSGTRVNFHGDELDVFAFFLRQGFNIGEMEFDGTDSLFLTPASKQLDPYFISKDSAANAAKPTLAMTPRWKAILGRLESRQPPDWLDAALLLLNVPHDDQRKIERGFEHLGRMVRRGKLELQHNWATTIVGPPQRRFFLAFFPYINTLRDTRNSVIASILNGLEARECRGAICVAFDLNSDTLPYAAVSINRSPNLFDGV